MNTKPHEPTGVRTLGRRAAAGLIPILAIGWIISTSGCTYSPYLRDVLAPYDEMKCQCVVAMKARSSARALWNSKYAHCYGRLGNARDIRQGFIDGYVATALGQKTTCLPIVPPDRYCGIGRKVEANCWFQGYPLGVVAAESNGACEMCTMTISPELTACMAQQTCNPGCIPCDNRACGCGNPQCDGSCGVPAAPAIVNLPQAFEAQVIEDQAMEDQPFEHAEDVAIQEPIDYPGSEPDADTVPAPKADDATDRIEDATPLNDLEDTLSPSDVAPPSPQEVIERAIDDVTSATKTVKPTVTQVEMPTQVIEAADGPSVVNEAVAPILSTSPVVGEPVEMPNMQVSFDLYDEGWLFGEVDIARALLEDEAQSVWTTE